MLIALDDMKNYLGIPLLDTSNDAFLTLNIQVVSDAIEGYCKRKFASATYTQTFYKNKFQSIPDSLPLYHYPLVSIASVVEKDEDAEPGTPVTDYRYHNPTGILEKNWGRFFANGNMVVAEYVAGYAVIPALIQSVTYSLVQERYNKRMSGVSLDFGSDVQRISVPGVISIDFDYSLNNNERKTHFGTILGSHINVLDSYASERHILGDVRLVYVQ